VTKIFCGIRHSSKSNVTTHVLVFSEVLQVEDPWCVYMFCWLKRRLLAKLSCKVSHAWTRAEPGGHREASSHV